MRRTGEDKVRIFYVCMDRASASVRNSRILRTNFYETLIDMGCEVVDFGLQNYINPGTQEVFDPGILSQRLVESVKRAIEGGGLDLVFTFIFNNWVSAEVIKEVRKYNVPIVNFYCNPHQFELIERLAPAFDYCWVPEKSAIELYRRIGAKPIHLWHGGNPNFYRTLDMDKDLGLVFIGRQKSDRSEIIRKLADAGLPVRVWGPGWKELIPNGGPLRRIARATLRTPGFYDRIFWKKIVASEEISDEEMIAVFSRARIIIGCSKMPKTDKDGKETFPRFVNLRDVEAPMCGGCYLVEEVEEIKDYYKVGSEILTYDNDEELIEKAHWLLRNPDKRMSIARAGRMRAIREHTMAHRFMELFRKIGLDKKKLNRLVMPAYES